MCSRIPVCVWEMSESNNELDVWEELFTFYKDAEEEKDNGVTELCVQDTND